MYLDKAKQILENEYKEKYALTHTAYQKAFMDEKIKHSYQVFGAGKYLLKHEEYFSRCSEEEIDYYQAIVLLHDICRFYEIIENEKGRHIDHGICGAAFLAEVGFFSQNDAILAIRHHGHLIEELYDDEDYKKLSASEREHVKRISYLVRDADKLANFYLVASHFEDIRPVFFEERNFSDPHNKNITPQVLVAFLAHRSVKKSDVRSFGDYALMFLAWIFDLNYHSSFVFLQKTCVLEKLFCMAGEFWHDSDMQSFRRNIEDFILSKM